MTCKEAQDRVLTRDQDESFDAAVHAHLLACPRCRRLAQRIAVADEVLRHTSAADPEQVDAVMATIDKNGAFPTRAHSLLRWLLGGALLLTALPVVRHSAPFRFLLGSGLGPRVDLSVTVAIGSGLVVYMAIFVAAHGDRLDAMIRNLPSRRIFRER